jgi:hypothetical protein
MPTHVSNSLYIKGDVDLVKKIRQTIISEKMDDQGRHDLIDFNKIVPLPEKFNLSNITQQIHIMKKYGCDTFSDYCIKIWGTKWNAYSFDHDRSDDNVIYFLTAWHPPLPVIEKLSQMFPTAEFTIMFADENRIGFTGKITYKNGAILSYIFPGNDSKLAFDFYCELWGYVDADYQKWLETGEIDNNY